MAHVERHHDLAGFWALTRDFYTADPVLHTVPITVVGLRLRDPIPDEEPPVLVTVTDGGRVVAAALRTPPFPLEVTGVAPQWAPAVAEALADADVELPAVSGQRDSVEAFVLAWTERTRWNAVENQALRLFRLGELDPPRDVPGTARPATEADRDVLERWHYRFVDEAVPHEPDPERSRRYVERGLSTGTGHLLWVVDDEPVAWASASIPLEGMSRVAPVYTPPEHRRHGYGAAVTAAVSTWAMKQGAEHVVLFTDLANPISNSIYQRIGYRPVTDAAEFSFTPPGP
ncbi:GNAT family N-acetyltransferase [Saccharothrix variisporea]|uniref:Putative GNAT family acetyltransferase n=1 Tax=Saccharothrix variisporea TaxID=543527 RepID=A0A495XCZ1_9PSEU|nr:GNAT family N-acetyltransferase [Saccharothrix variisporea]RKT70483.1 putative GNAT family acetyltransferase [Saccharothrix variisporea]